MEFFHRAVTRFQASGIRLEVICTIDASSRDASTTGNIGPRLPDNPPSALVVLDSSFNPPTIAHLQMAVSAIGEVKRERQRKRRSAAQPGHVLAPEVVRLLLLLAINNADKAPKPAEFHQRLAMMYAFALDVQGALKSEEGKPVNVAGNTDSLAIDIALTTQPYFHQKSEVIAECRFYAGRSGMLAHEEQDAVRSGQALLEEREKSSSGSSPEDASIQHERQGKCTSLPPVSHTPHALIKEAMESSNALQDEQAQEVGPWQTAAEDGGLSRASSVFDMASLNPNTYVSQQGPKALTFADRQEPEQIILAGFDTLIRIFNPKYYGTRSNEGGNGISEASGMRAALDPFFKRARLRVTMRPDDEWGSKDEQLEHVRGLLGDGGLEKVGGLREWASRVDLVEGSSGQRGVSSTQAREAASKKDWGRLRDMVGRAVVDVVTRESLYAPA